MLLAVEVANMTLLAFIPKAQGLPDCRDIGC